MGQDKEIRNRGGEGKGDNERYEKPGDRRYKIPKWQRSMRNPINRNRLKNRQKIRRNREHNRGTKKQQGYATNTFRIQAEM